MNALAVAGIGVAILTSMLDLSPPPIAMTLFILVQLAILRKLTRPLTNSSGRPRQLLGGSLAFLFGSILALGLLLHRDFANFRFRGLRLIPLGLSDSVTPFSVIVTVVVIGLTWLLVVDFLPGLMDDDATPKLSSASSPNPFEKGSFFKRELRIAAINRLDPSKNPVDCDRAGEFRKRSRHELAHGRRARK